MFIKKITIIFLAVFWLFFSDNQAFGLHYPQPTGYVNDYAGIISDDFQSSLEIELKDFEAQTSHEIAVVTLSSIKDEPIENVAVELFEEWGIGKQSEDNGVLLLIALEQRSMRIEVGYGLESILTDSRAGRIIRDQITPEFKNQDYDSGIKNGVQAIKTTIANPGAYDSQPVSTTNQADFIGAFMFIGFMLTIYVAAFLGRSKRFWPGGVIGIFIGYLFGSLSSRPAALISAFLLGIWGLFLDFILSKNYKKLTKKGLPTSFTKSRGGFWTGGSSRSSGSSFGGFGGGSSGGGGASGSW